MKYCANPECPYVEEFGNPASYNDDKHHCLDCDALLVSGAPPESHAESLPDEPLVTLARFSTPPQAQMAAAWLDEAGIDHVLTDKRHEPTFFPPGSHWTILLQTDPDDAEAASRILSERMGSGPPDGWEAEAEAAGDADEGEVDELADDEDETPPELI